jgi:hypothetical protein
MKLTDSEVRLVRTNKGPNWLQATRDYALLFALAHWSRVPSQNVGHA